jgi:hypothetical protein
MQYLICVSPPQLFKTHSTPRDSTGVSQHFTPWSPAHAGRGGGCDQSPQEHLPGSDDITAPLNAWWLAVASVLHRIIRRCWDTKTPHRVETSRDLPSTRARNRVPHPSLHPPTCPRQDLHHFFDRLRRQLELLTLPLTTFWPDRGTTAPSSPYAVSKRSLTAPACFTWPTPTSPRLSTVSTTRLSGKLLLRGVHPTSSPASRASTLMPLQESGRRCVLRSSST